MARGPDKQFDPGKALEQTILLFWEKGYSAASMAALQARTGLGAKSLYDTFGNKRQLYFKAIEYYTETVINQVYGKLPTADSPLDGVHSAMGKIARMDAREHRGCLLGVAMAQAQLQSDQELTDFLQCQLQAVEDTLYQAFERAKALGELGEHVDARNMASLYMAALQGFSLISRVNPDTSISTRARSALTSLTTGR